jgi:hypothetical protein
MRYESIYYFLGNPDIPFISSRQLFCAFRAGSMALTEANPSFAGCRSHRLLILALLEALLREYSGRGSG